MAWQIKTSYDRWLNKDERGFYTTSQPKALVITSQAELNETLTAAREACPGVEFTPIEVPG